MKKIIFPTLHFTLERWKYNIELDAWVSTEGRIKDNEGHIQSLGKSNGYLYYKGKAVHRVVLATWKPVPGYAKLTVDHVNRNTCDNRLMNLEWKTGEDNVAKASIEDKSNTPESTLDKNTMFLINNAPMTYENAVAMMRADNHLDKCANISRAFTNAFNKTEPISFGGYNIQRIPDGKNN